MKTKDAMKILGVSRATVHNWIKQGRLRLNKTLSNGYYDIEDLSVYEMLEFTYEPSTSKNRLMLIMSNGTKHIFFPTDIDA